MLLLLLLNSLYSQPPGNCTPFYFEVCRIVPDLSSYPPTPTNPGPFHGYYKVKLKSSMGVLPNTWNVNYLAFSGKISVNGFTSRINIDQTNAFSQTNGFGTNPFFQYLSVSEDGEVDWTVGSVNDCTSGEPGTNLDFPVGAFEVELFTIVVDGVPGDFVNFTGDNPNVDWVAEVKDCNLFNCSGTMPVLGCTTPPNFLIAFPPPASCNNPQKTVTFEFEIIPPGTRLIQVKMNNLVPDQIVAKSDMVLHIQPQMSGINNLDLEPVQANGGPGIEFSEKRKNQDGSFDIYIRFNPFHPGPFTTAHVLSIIVNGHFNLSQGANLSCSMSPGRGVYSTFPRTICSLTGITNTLMIPGYGACPDIIDVASTRYVGPGCTLGVKYTITHNASAPIDLSYLKLLFAFKLTNGNNSPGTPSTTLPCQSCGTLSYNATADVWEYAYVQNTALSLSSGMEVIVPFNLSVDCIKYYVVFAEAMPSGGSVCATGVTFDIDQWPACESSVRGSIAIDNLGVAEPAPQYGVKLESTSDPSYYLYNEEGCEEEYSFCPNPAKSPFRIRLEHAVPNDYLCGVTTYDLVLISKHILGIAPITEPKLLIAADASLMLTGGTSGVTTNDIASIRKCILGITPDFGDQSAPSWWYFKDGYTFQTPNPLNPPYTDSNISAVPANGLGSYGNFFAVKVGDINQTCGCGMRPAGSKNAQAFISVPMPETKQGGRQLSIPIWSDAPFDLIAVQMGFRFDPAQLELRAIIPNTDWDIQDYNFGKMDIESGELKFAWSPLDGQTPLPKKVLLFTLEFEMKMGGESLRSPYLWSSNEVLQNLLYQEDGLEFPVKLDWQGNNRAAAPQELGLIVSPNPFYEETRAFVYAGEPTTALAHLSDSRGRMLFQQTLELQAGENTVQIRPNSPTLPGVYFLTLETEGQKVQRQIVKL